MTIYLKQSTAGQEVTLGHFLDSTDGNTEETALSIANTDIKLHKAGATTLANKNSGGATHISNGIYYAVLDATDTNTLGSLVIYCHPSGALAVKVDCVVLAANVYDSMIGGGDTLDVQVTGIGANVITATSIATDAITAAKIAANAIGASELAADAVTEIQSGLATAAALATVDSNVNAILVDTGTTLPASIATIDTNVDSILTDTGTTIPAQISALNNISSADVNAACDTALADYDGPTNTEMVAAFTEIKGATFSGATDSLEAIRDRGDAAWVTGAGGSAPSAADIRAEIDANSTQLAAIVADTNELQTNQGNWLTADISGLATASALATVDSNVDAILVDTGTTIPAALGTPSVTIADDIAGISAGSGLDAAGVRAAIGLSSANLDTQLSTIDTVVDGIQADLSNGTDGLGALSADIAAISAGSGLTAQEVRDAMKLAPTAGSPAAGSIDAHLDTIEADTNELQTNQGNWATATGFATASNLATVDTVVDAIKVKTDQLVFTKTNELDVNVQSINGGEITGDGKTTPYDVA